ncbi:MAG TPA: hypothetical protein VI216_02335 [Candidatus Acidoferrales bacterium]|nr:hypothetical protein [Terriglobales bacterium]
MDQSFGATKALPKTVVLGMSAERCSDVLVAGLDGSCAMILEEKRMTITKMTNLQSRIEPPLLNRFQLSNKRLITKVNNVQLAIYATTPAGEEHCCSVLQCAHQCAR